MERETHIQEVDGFLFALSKGGNTIYVFKGEALVTSHFCVSYEKALEVFEKVKHAKRVIIRE